MTDPDGTLPCLAVRAVLEHEQDGTLEDALVISRMNQRGVTERGVYSGAISEELAKRYEADGGQEDRKGRAVRQVCRSWCQVA